LASDQGEFHLVQEGLYCQFKNCPRHHQERRSLHSRIREQDALPGDKLAAVGKPIDDDELIFYMFTGLDFEYNSVVSTLLAKEVLTVGDVYS
jgi:hypothetical protein